MAYQISCAGCGDAEDIEVMKPPGGWAELIQKTYGLQQVDDITERIHLCSSCCYGALDRAAKP